MGLTVGVFFKKDILILRLKGELDEVSVCDLRIKISSYIDTYKINHLIINMKELNFLDSSGIGFIIGRYHQLKFKDGDITLCQINPKIEKLIYVSGLAKICKIRETEESVLIALED